MRISFDVDDTLVLHGLDVPPEQGWLPSSIQGWFGEPLRRGTRSLIGELRKQGCEIWIYTTSGRTPFQVWRWLISYGVGVDGFINDVRHSRALTSHRSSRVPSKFPPAFGIDLHVDNSEGVLMEGKELGFRVVVVEPSDETWTQVVLKAVCDLKRETSRGTQ